MIRTRSSRGSAVFILAVLFVASIPSRGASQGLGELLASCEAVDPGSADLCLHGGLSARATFSALSLAASGGADVPGSASTLGWRLKGSPRMAISLKGGVFRAPLPTFRNDGVSPGGETQAAFPALNATATLGLFDGFSPGPTMGGVGSIDLMVSGQWIGTPQDEGFTGKELGWGYGARLGILRESFSLPGISFSVFRRSLGDVRINEADPNAAFSLDADLEVTALRGIVGKDLAGIGLFAGAGWDRASGGASLSFKATDGAGGQVTDGRFGFVDDNLQLDRHLLFLGGSMTFLAFQVSVEAGLASGFDEELPESGSTDFDPDTRSAFLGVGLRLTF